MFTAFKKQKTSKKMKSFQRKSNKSKSSKSKKSLSSKNAVLNMKSEQKYKLSNQSQKDREIKIDKEIQRIEEQKQKMQAGIGPKLQKQQAQVPFQNPLKENFDEYKEGMIDAYKGAFEHDTEKLTYQGRRTHNIVYDMHVSQKEKDLNQQTKPTENEFNEKIRASYKDQIKKRIEEQRDKGIQAVKVDMGKVKSHLSNYKQKSDTRIAIKKEFFQLWIKIMKHMKKQIYEREKQNQFILDKHVEKPEERQKYRLKDIVDIRIEIDKDKIDGGQGQLMRHWDDITDVKIVDEPPTEELQSVIPFCNNIIKFIPIERKSKKK